MSAEAIEKQEKKICKNCGQEEATIGRLCSACESKRVLSYRDDQYYYWSTRYKAMKQRAQEFGVVDTLTFEDYLDIIVEDFENEKATCVYCGIEKSKRELDVDHIIPLQVGGPNDRFNLALCCRSCNIKKGGNQHVISFHFANKDRFPAENLRALIAKMAKNIGIDYDLMTEFLLTTFQEEKKILNKAKKLKGEG